MKITHLAYNSHLVVFSTLGNISDTLPSCSVVSPTIVSLIYVSKRSIRLPPTIS
uniref:Uncharacterized protein n=1 Tax=Ascaris lumbricoides TaxID=6252 RepID=A0A0M3HHY0_ASCLU